MEVLGKGSEFQLPHLHQTIALYHHSVQRLWKGNRYF